MPIIAVCPYCHEGKVRAPDRAVGLSATCPCCESCFTIVASKEPVHAPTIPATPRPPAPVPAPVAAPATARSDRPVPSPPPRPEVAIPPEPDAATDPDATEEPDALETPEDTPDVDYPPPKPEPAFVLSLVAITIAGVSLLVSQVPYGRVGAALGAGLGLL